MIVGDGPARASLARKYPQAVFLGSRQGEALAEAYAGADVFVFPSRTDTFGLVLLEALASGLPVAAFPVTGPRDVIGTAPVGALNDDLRAACLAALNISPQSLPRICRWAYLGGLGPRLHRQYGRHPHRRCEQRSSAVRGGTSAVWSPEREARAACPPVWVRDTTMRMTQHSQDFPVDSADIDAAAAVLAPFAVRTPLLSSPALDERVGTRVFLKPEMLQRTGSFKFRGAFNKMSSIPESARGGGVVAFSSGNHAQGVAAAARILNMPATIVMPADAPLSKRERTKAYGAEVVLYDRDREDREAIARDIAGKRGATLVRPYDDPFVIAGQGTVGPGDRRGYGRPRPRPRYRGGAGLRRRAGRGRRDRGQGALSEGDADVGRARGLRRSCPFAARRTNANRTPPRAAPSATR